MPACKESFFIVILINEKLCLCAQLENMQCWH